MRAASALLLLAIALTGGAQAQPKDRVLSTRTVNARLVGFSTGDYVHAVVKTAKGREESFFVGSGPIAYFLAVHAKQPLRLQVQKVDSYIPEAGGRMTIERISSARSGKLDDRTWWKRLRNTSSVQQLEKRFDPLLDRLELRR